ncbi:glycoside hydrolase family 25 protein [Limibacter armeniacum]|uniref:glycoside hydrolase family 25 protein n=1 Tax=Limibacter armeniacum TaxID=466084 RepID=UPI002FE55154
MINQKKFGFQIHGIDVSYYQEQIDWSKVSQDEIVFCFIKATEGISIQDSKFHHNWAQASEAGIIRGAYHFFRPTVKPHIQAKKYIENVKLEEGDLPPVLDLETLDGIPPKIFRKAVKEWVELIESHYQIKPILYTNVSFYQDYLQGNFVEYPIWIAAYNKIIPPKLSNRKENWMFWQHTDSGSVNGITGSVDLNVFRGTLEQLQSMCIQGLTPSSKRMEASKVSNLPKISDIQSVNH